MKKLLEWKNNKTRSGTGRSGTGRSGTVAIKTFSVLLSVSFVIVAMGFGCGMGFEPVGSRTLKSVQNNSQGGGGSSSGIPDFSDNGNLTVISGAVTASLPMYSALGQSFSNMTGVALSTTSLSTINQKLESLSESGLPTTMNAPLQISAIAIGAEVCNDLLNVEDDIAAANRAQRRFFTTLNSALADNTATRSVASDTDLTEIINRLARNLWQRSPTAEEVALILGSVKTMIPQGTATQSNDRRVAHYICSAMIASTDAIQL